MPPGKDISGKNLKRLKELAHQVDPEMATLAALMLDIAPVQPHKRHRWVNLARHHTHVFERAINVLKIEFFEDLLAGCGISSRRFRLSWISTISHPLGRRVPAIAAAVALFGIAVWNVRMSFGITKYHCRSLEP